MTTSTTDPETGKAIEWLQRETRFATDAHEMNAELQHEVALILAVPPGTAVSAGQYARAAQLIACRRNTCGGPGRGHDHAEERAATARPEVAELIYDALGHPDTELDLDQVPGWRHECGEPFTADEVATAQGATMGELRLALARRIAHSEAMIEAFGGDDRCD